jgi:HEPN domain-containing protein
VNSQDDVEYRIKLADGFFKESKEDINIKRWRSCVANSQLVVENAGKAILMLFGISPKTHEPAKHLDKLIRDVKIPSDIKDKLKKIMPEFLALGVEEHFMTDYGEESSYLLPWDIFDEDSARNALKAAKQCKQAAEQIVKHVQSQRAK